MTTEEIHFLLDLAGERPPRARPWSGGSPGTIPNPAVKPRIAESTAGEARGRIGRRARGGRFFFHAQGPPSGGPFFYVLGPSSAPARLPPSPGSAPSIWNRFERRVGATAAAVLSASIKGWGSTSGSCAVLFISGRRIVVWLQRRFHGVAHDARTAENADELAVFGDGHFLQLALGKQAAGIFKRRAGGNGDDAFRGDLAYRELEQRWTREPC